MDRLLRHLRQLSVTALLELGLTAMVFVVLAAAPKTFAAVGINRAINYQGKLSSTGGLAIANGQYNMRFKIFTQAEGGVAAWTETWNNTTQRVTSTGGLFSIALGTHVTMTGSVDFNSDSLYLQVEFDPGNDGTYEEIFAPRRRFASVPYAHNANTLDGLDSTQFIRADQSATASGTITVRPRTAAKIGIDILSQGGSSATGAIRLSTQGGPHLLFGSGGLNYDTNLYRPSANTLKTDDGFHVVGTLSGSNLTVSRSASISGTLLVKDDITAKADFYIYDSAENNRLRMYGVNTSTFEVDLVGSTSGTYYFSSDFRVGVGTSTPKAQFGVLGTISGSRLSISGNANITGALLTVGNITTRGVLSGSNLTVSRSASISGTLIVKTGITSKGSLSGATFYGAGLGSCTGTYQKLLYNPSTGQFTCGAISTTSTFGTGNVLTIGDSRYVNTSGDTMTGALIVQATMSGRHLVVSQSASVSGALMVKGNGTVRGTLSGTNLTVSRSASISGTLLVKTSVTTKGFLSGATMTLNPTSITASNSATTGINIWGGVGGAAGYEGLRISLTNSTADTAGFFRMVRTAGTTFIGAEIGVESNHGVRFLTNGTADSAEKMRLSAAGNLSIGTLNNGGSRLSVSGSAIISSDGRLSTSAADTTATLEVVGAISGSRLTITNNANISGALLVRNNIVSRGTISGYNLTVSQSASISGTLIVKTGITSKGSLSGATFYGAGLGSCTGTYQKLLYNPSTGQFTCGAISTTSTFGTGNVLTIGDSRYVNQSGDTMTGILKITKQGGYYTGALLNVLGTMSGRSLYISGSGGATAPLIFANSANGRVGIGTSNPTSTLSLYGSFGINLINSGTDFLTVDNTDNGRLVLDASDPHSQQIIFTPRSSTTGRGTAAGLTDFSAALNIVNGIYLGSTLNSFDVGITRSAAGILKVNDGSTGLAALHASLLSGTNLTVSRSASISGTLIVKTGITSKGSLSGATFYGAGLGSCTGTYQKLLYNPSTGQFTCGSISTASTFGTGNVITIGDARYVKKSGDTMTGALTINVTNGNLNTVGLKVINTLSGAHLHAERTLSSSGALVWEGVASGSALRVMADSYFMGKLGIGTDTPSSLLHLKGATPTITLNDPSISGNVTIKNSGGDLLLANASAGIGTQIGFNGSAYWYFRDSSLMWTSDSTASIGINNGETTTLTLENPSGGQTMNILMDGNLTVQGTGNSSFAGNVGIGTTTPRAKLEVSGSISGATLFAQTLSGAGLTDCDAASQVLKWDATNEKFSCGADLNTGTFGTGNVLTIGDARYLRRSGGTMTGQLVVDITGGNFNTVGLKVINTLSGAHLHAERTLSSSGALVWEGTASGNALRVMADSYFLGDLSVGTTSAYSSYALTVKAGDANQKALALRNFETDAEGLLFTLGQDYAYIDSVNYLQIRSAAERIYLQGDVWPTTVGYDLGGTGSEQQWDTLYVRNISPRPGEGTLTIYSNSDAGDIAFNNYTRQMMVLKGGGNLGLGTSTPNSRLAVSGAIIVGTNLSSQSADAGVSLEVLGLMSGSRLAISSNANISGALLVRNNIVSLGTISGYNLTVSQSASISGTLIVKTGITSKGSVSGSTIDGFGLGNCTGSTQKLLYNATTDKFECGTISASSSFSTGNVLTIGDARYVKKSGDTMTGTLVLNPQSGLALNARGTISGSRLNISNTAHISGGLLVKGNVGIGTTAPQANLHISNATAGKLYLSDTSATFTADLGVDNDVFRLKSLNGSFGDHETPFTIDLNTGLATFSDSVTASYFTHGSWEIGNATYLGADKSGFVYRDGDNYPSLIVENSSVANGSLIIKANGSVGISTSTPRAKLEVNGSISGATLFAQSFSGAGLVDCDATSQKLYWDSTNEKFSCGSDYTGSFSTGNVLTIGDARYVKKSGDTMTGILKITKQGGYYTGALLNVLGTMSGRSLYISGSGGATAPLIFANSNNGRVGIGTASPTVGLDIRSTDIVLRSHVAGNSLNFSFQNSDGTQIGSIATNNQLKLILDGYSSNGVYLPTGLSIGSYASGAPPTGGAIISGNVGIGNTGPRAKLEVSGAISGATLFAQSFSGAGLVDCDATSQKLYWDSTNEKFSCGSDYTGSFSTGNVLTIGDARYVKKSGDTMTGTLVLNPQSGLALNARGTISGYRLSISGNANITGSLLVMNNITARATLSGKTLTVMNGTSYLMGDVGIGVTSPLGTGTRKMHVAGVGGGANDYGSLALSNASNSGNNYAGSLDYYVSSNLLAAIRAQVTSGGNTGDLSFYTTYGGTLKEYVRLTSTGAFLVGATNGSTNGYVHVNNGNYGSLSNGLILANNNTGAGSDIDIKFQAATASTYASLRGIYAGSSAGGLAFSTHDGSSFAERARFSAAGNLGIGTTAPKAKLDVVGTVSGSRLNISNTAHISGALLVKGNVGIGTTTPDHVLHVQGAADGTDVSNIKIAGNGTYGGIAIYEGTSSWLGGIGYGDAGHWFSDASTDSLSIRATNSLHLGNGAGADMTIVSSGNVGIGTTTPRAKLEVAGSISGATLFAQSFSGAGLVDCDATSQKLYWDSTNEKFSCGSDYTGSFSTGNVLTIGDARYLRRSGGTMTGQLVVDITGGNFNTVGLKVVNTLSGAHLHAERLLTSSGTAIVKGNITTQTGSLWQSVYRTDDGLVGYWSFSETGSTTAYDRSPYGNDGTLTNGAAFLNGKYGTAMRFDGVNDYVDLGTSASLSMDTGPLTVSAWFYSPTPTADQTIVGNGPGAANYGLTYGYTNNKIDFWNNGGGPAVTSSGSITDGAWHHVAVTRTGSSGNWTIRLYIDGVLDKTQVTAANPSAGSPVTTSIGRFGGFNGYYFNGGIDEVRIYNRALTQEEIRTQYLGVDSNTAIIANKFRILNTSNTVLLNMSDADRTLEFVGTLSGSRLSVSGNANITGSLLTVGNITTRGTLSGYNLTVSRSASISGTLIVKTGITSKGSVSGSTIDGFGLGGCTGTYQKLMYNASTDKFECGSISTASTFGTGNVLTIGDARYVKKSGDTMTGTLVVTPLTGLAINARGTISGYRLVISGNANVTGSILAVGNINSRATISGSRLVVSGHTNISGSLLVLRNITSRGTISGSTLTVSSASSFSGAVSMLRNLTVRGTISGSRLVVSGHTNISGSLLVLRNITTRATLSGTNLTVSRSASISGTLIVKTGITSKGSVSGSTIDGFGLGSCTGTYQKLLYNASTDKFECGSISTASTFGTGNVLTIGDARYVRKSGDTMTGALIINITNGNINTLGLRVINTISGAVVHAENALTSSGIAVIETLTTMRGSGALSVVQNAEFGTGAYIYSSGTVLALDTFSGRGDTKHILFGYRGVFDTNLYRSATTTLRTDGSFIARDLLSGSNLTISRSASISGTLLVKTSITSKGSLSGVTIAGFNLGSCNGAMQKLLYNYSTQKFECGTDQNTNWSNTGSLRAAFDNRYVNQSGDTMTGALKITKLDGYYTGALLNVLGVGSGAHFFGQNGVSSSGTLAVEQRRAVGSGALTVDQQANNTGAFITSRATSYPLLALSTVTANTRAPHILLGADGTFDVALYRSAAQTLSLTGHLLPASTNTFDLGSATNRWRDLYLSGGTIRIGDSTNETALRYNKSGSGFSIDVGNDGVREFVVKPSGNIGFGTDSPTNPIDIRVGAGDQRGFQWVAGSQTDLKIYRDVDKGNWSILRSSLGSGITLMGQADVLALTVSRYTSNVGIRTTDAETALEVVGTISGSRLVLSGNAQSSGSLLVLRGITTRGTLSGSNLTVSRSASISGTLIVKTGITSKGSVSGSTIDGFGLGSCNSGTSKLLYNATTDQFECGTITASSSSFSTGNVLTISDSRYVNVSGDTMTGQLIIDIMNGNFNTVGLKVINTLSGARLHAEKLLTASGMILGESGALLDGGTFYVDAGNNRVGILTTSPRVALDVNGDIAVTMNRKFYFAGSNNTGFYSTWNSTQDSLDFFVNNTVIMSLDSTNYFVGMGKVNPSQKLEVVGTISGSRLSISNNANISGALLVRNNVGIGTTTPRAKLEVAGSISGATLFAQTLSGAGLTDCDAASQVLKWDATNEKFSCGADLNSGTFGTGNVLTVGDARYVKKSGDTMTGILKITKQNGYYTGALLNVLGGMSGRSLYISGSGGSARPLISALSEKGYVGIGTSNPTAKLTVSGNGGANATLLVTAEGAGNNAFIKLADGTTGETWDLQGLTDGSFSIARSTARKFTIDSAGDVGINTLTPRTRLEVAGSGTFIGTISGYNLTISRSGSISGALLVKTSITSKGSVSGSTIGGFGLGSCNGSNQKLLFNASSGQFECSVDQTAASGMAMTDADARYVKKSGDTMTGALRITKSGGYYTGALLNVLGGMSGRSLVISGTGARPLIATNISTGRVGFGTGAPVLQYHFVSSGANAGVRFERKGANGQGGAGAMEVLTDARTAADSVVISLRALDSNLNIINYGQIGAEIKSPTSGADSSKLHFITRISGTSNYRMTLDEDKLGIGTTSPKAKLDVVGTVSGARLSISQNANISGALITKSGAFIGNTLYVYSQTGRVGINTAAPEAELDVKLDGNAGTPIKWRTNNGSAKGGIYADSVSDIVSFGSITNNDVGLYTFGGSATFILKKSGNVGIGTLTPRSKLEVAGSGTFIGTISGYNLTISRSGSISGALLVKTSITSKGSVSGSTIGGFGLGSCNGAGQKLLFNASSGKFECSVDQTAASGMAMTDGDARYVKKSGDTMTGALRITKSGGYYTGTLLNVLGIMSGNKLAVSNGGTITGSLIISRHGGAGGIQFQNADFSYSNGIFAGASNNFNFAANWNVDQQTQSDASKPTWIARGVTGNGDAFQFIRRSPGSSTDDVMFVVLPGGIASGSTIRAQSTLASSGVLVVAGNGTVRGTLSGSNLTVSRSASISGTLIVKTGITSKGSVSGSTIDGFGLGNCTGSTQKLLYNASTDKFECGTISASSSFSTGNVLTIGDARYVKKSGDTMTGQLVINLTSGTIGLRVLQTMSGDTLFISKGATFSGTGVVITSSGQTVFNEQGRNVDFRVEGDTRPNLFSIDASRDAVYIDGIGGTFTPISQESFRVASYYNTFTSGGGSLTALQIENTSSNNLWQLVTVGTSGYAGAPAGAFALVDSGSAGFIIEASTPANTLYLDSPGTVGIGTSAPKAKLDVVGTISGSRLVISQNGAFSGSVVVRNTLSGSSLIGFGLGDCNNATTSKLIYNNSTGKFSCATDQTGGGSGLSFTAAEGIYVNQAGDTMTGALILSPTAGSGVTALRIVGKMTLTGSAVLQSSAAGTIALTVKGAVGQTANLQEWQNSAGTVKGSIDASGIFTLTSAANTSLKIFAEQNSASVFQAVGTTGGRWALHHSSATTNASMWSGDINSGTAPYIYIGPSSANYSAGGAGAKITVETSVGSIGIRTLSPKEALDVVGTISGSRLSISNNANISGSLLVKNNITSLGTLSGYNLTVSRSASISGTLIVKTGITSKGSVSGSTIDGFGLGSCNSGTSKLLYNATTDQFECGTISASSSSFSTGNVLTIGDARYVRKSGDTMTGTLVITPQAGLALNARGTISGYRLVVSGNAGITGALLVQGNITSRSTISGALITQNGGGNNYFLGSLGVGLTNPSGIGTPSKMVIRSTTTAGSHIGQLALMDSTTMGQGVGGLITFGGNYIGTSSDYTWAGIQGAKENATGGNTDGALIFYTKASSAMSEKMRIASTGNVGVGTTNPRDRFVVSGSGTFVGTLSGLNLTVSRSASISGTLLVKSNLATKGILSGATLTIQNSGTVSGALLVKGPLTTKGTLSGSRLIVSGHANISGSLLAKGNLNVRGNMSGVNLTVSRSASISGALIVRHSIVSRGGISGNTLFINKNAAFAGSGVTISSSGQTVFNVLNRNVDFRIASSGNNNMFYVDASTNRIGIGTNGPETELEVIGTLSGRNLFGMNAVSASGSLAVEQSRRIGSGALVVEQRSNSTGAYLRSFTTTGAPLLALDNWRRNWRAPHIMFGYRGSFDVAMYRSETGTLAISGSVVIDNTLAVQVYGAATATTVCRTSTGMLATCSSSLRYKEDVQDLDMGLETIRSMRAVNFKWQGRDERDFGFIAEEMEAINPLLVEYDAQGQVQGVKYMQLTAVLTKAVQALDMRLLGITNASGTVLHAKDLLSTSGSLLIASSTTDGNTDLLRITSNVGGTGNTVFRVNASGAVYSDSTFNSSGADYAEWFKTSDSTLKPGDVVCVDILSENAVKRCERAADPNLMGIISTNPAFIGNTIRGADGMQGVSGYALVGLIGQVPAKVSAEGGVIRPGDSLTSGSVPGTARKAKAGESTVGVALEPYDGTQQKNVVNVLISRRNQSLTVEAVEQEVFNSIASMNIGDEISRLVQSATHSIDVNDQVTAAVEAELDALDLNDQINTIVTERLSGVVLSSSMELTPVQIQQVTALISGAQSTGALLIADLEEAVRHLSDRVSALEDALSGGTLRAAAGRFGTLTATGLTLVSGTSSLELSLSGSELQIGSLMATGSLRVIGNITVTGLAEFLGDVRIKGELILSSKQAGFAVIPQTGTSVTVFFPQPMTATPVVTATPDVPTLYAVSRVTATGFTIRISPAASEKITFSYIALSADAPRTVMGTGAVAGSTQATPFPVNSLGQPVSSDEVWNSCIIGQPLLLADGSPVSCARYHDGPVWQHPDLGISFTYRPNNEPPLLLIPEGYVLTVTADTASSSSASSESSDTVSSSTSSVSSSDSSSSDSSATSSDSSSSQSSVTSSASSSSSSESSVQSSTSSSVSSSASSDASESTASSEPAPEPAPESIEPPVESADPAPAPL